MEDKHNLAKRVQACEKELKELKASHIDELLRLHRIYDRLSILARNKEFHSDYYRALTDVNKVLIEEFNQ